MSLEGGREGREGRGGEGRGGGWGWGAEGREGGREEGGEGGGMTVIHIILMTPKYSYNNDVTYYVITYKSTFDWVYAEQWYVIITSDVTWTE